MYQLACGRALTIVLCLRGARVVGTYGDPAVEVLKGFRQAAGVLGLVCRERGGPVLLWDVLPVAAGRSGGGGSAVLRDRYAEN